MAHHPECCPRTGDMVDRGPNRNDDSFHQYGGDRRGLQVTVTCICHGQLITRYISQPLWNVLNGTSWQAPPRSMLPAVECIDALWTLPVSTEWWKVVTCAQLPRERSPTCLCEQLCSTCFGLMHGRGQISVQRYLLAEANGNADPDPARRRTLRD